MAKNKGKFIGFEASKKPEIFLAIDDLEDGRYVFHIVQNDKVIKTFKINKSDEDEEEE